MDDITDTDFRLLLADIQHMTWTAQLAHMVTKFYQQQFPLLSLIVSFLVLNHLF